MSVNSSPWNRLVADVTFANVHVDNHASLQSHFDNKTLENRIARYPALAECKRKQTRVSTRESQIQVNANARCKEYVI